MALAVNDLSSVAGAGAAVGATFPILADPQHRVAEAYGVFNLLGDQLAAPAVFVIDRDGRIRWSYIGQSSQDRPSVADILARLP